MAKRTRVTTSVSTLVNDVATLIDVARMAGRKDLVKEFNTLANDVSDIVEQYNETRATISHFKNLLAAGRIAEIEIEEEEEEENAEV